MPPERAEEGGVQIGTLEGRAYLEKGGEGIWMIRRLGISGLSLAEGTEITNQSSSHQKRQVLSKLGSSHTKKGDSPGMCPDEQHCQADLSLDAQI